MTGRNLTAYARGVNHANTSNIHPSLLACSSSASVLGRGLCEIQAGTNEEKGLMMSDMTVAKEILRQLGGNKFIVMAGATSFAGGPDGFLSFRLPGRGFCKDGIRAVKIQLNSMDLYDVDYLAFRGSLKRGNYRVEVVAHSDGLYCDMLQSDFTAKTGLETSLGTCGRV